MIFNTLNIIIFSKIKTCKPSRSYGALFLALMFIIARGEPILDLKQENLNVSNVSSYGLYCITCNQVQELDDMLWAEQNLQISWKTIEEDNWGFGHEVLWVKILVKNTHLAQTRYVLGSSNNTLNFVNFYILDSTNTLIKRVITGNMLPFESRELKIRYPSIIMPDTKPGEVFKIYIRLETEDVMALNLFLKPIKEVLQEQYNLQMLEGIFFGALIIMILYNFFLYTAIKDKAYLFYVLYIGAFSIVQFDMGGWFFQYILPDMPMLSSRVGSFFYGLTTLFAIYFLEYFLPLSSRNRVINLGFYLGKGISICILGLSYLVSFKLILILVFSTALVYFVPFLLYTMVYSYLNGYVPSRYILIGWVTLLIGILLYSSANFGLLPLNIFITYSIQIGIILDATFLSFALADRINILRKEKQLANRETIFQLQKNSQLLDKLNKEQQRVFSALLEGEEKERVRIAKELHDGVGQILSATRIYLSNLEEIGSKKVTLDKDTLQNINKMVDDACSEIRNISHNLMPDTVVKYGLVKALEDFFSKINTIQRQTKIHFQHLDVSLELGVSINTSIYRMVQEIVNNTLKHAHATHMYVQLIQEDHELTITAEDNGIGFEKDNKTNRGLGLKNIQSRAEFIGGTFHIETSPGKGTQILITIPVKHT